MDSLKSIVLDDYKLMLAKIQTNEINLKQAGFITNTCVSSVFSYLVHCIENIDIFDDNELNNIRLSINKIIYGN